MWKFFSKNVIYAFLCAVCITALGGCIVEPVDLRQFVEDDDVIDIIERGMGSVKLTTDSEGDAGSGKVTNLVPNEYYLVEECTYDEGTNTTSITSTMFVKAGGQCIMPAAGDHIADLTGIGRLSGTTITGLTNDHLYRVRSAVALPGAGLTISPPSTVTPSIVDGLIKITLDPDTSYSLDFPGSFNINNYQITIPGSNALIPPGTIALAGAGTTDYVFAYSIISPVNFYVLRVTISTPSSLTITVSLSPLVDNQPVLNPTSASYQQNETGTLTISINNANQYTGITWYVDGAQVDGTEMRADSSFILDKSLVKYQLVGTFTLTVTAARDGVPYSAALLITVTASP